MRIPIVSDVLEGLANGFPPCCVIRYSCNGRKGSTLQGGMWR
jgi:hypothetical protein